MHSRSVASNSSRESNGRTPRVSKERASEVQRAVRRIVNVIMRRLPSLKPFQEVITGVTIEPVALFVGSR